MEGIKALVKNEDIRLADPLLRPGGNGMSGVQVGLGFGSAATIESQPPGEEISPQQLPKKNLLTGSVRTLYELGECHRKAMPESADCLPDTGAGLSFSVSCVQEQHHASPRPGSGVLQAGHRPRSRKMAVL